MPIPGWLPSNAFIFLSRGWAKVAIFALVIASHSPTFATNSIRELALNEVLNGRSAQEGTKQFVFKVTGLFAALDLYDHDRAAAMALINIDPVHNYTPKGSPLYPADQEASRRQTEMHFNAYPKERFAKIYSDQLDTEIKGKKFGDSNLAKVAREAVTGVLAFATDGYTLATGLVIKGTGNVATGSLFDNLWLKKPKATRATDLSVDAELAHRIATAEPDIRALVEKDLLNYMGIGNMDQLSNAAEFKTKLMKLQLDGTNFRIGDLNKMAAETLRKATLILAEESQAQLEAAREKVEREKSEREAIERHKNNQTALQAFELTTQFLQFIAESNGATPQQMLYFNATAKLINVLVESETAVAENPMTYTNPYIAAASIILGMLQAQHEQAMVDNQTQNTNLILDAIRDLAQHLDRIRDQIMNRFDQVDTNIMIGFARQESILKSILDFQRGHTDELSLISTAIENDREKVLKSFEKDFRRARELLWARCLTVPPRGVRLNQDLMMECRSEADLLSSKWAKEEIESNFDSLYPLKNSVQSPNIQIKWLEFNKVIPLFAKWREQSDNSNLPNPQFWIWGVDLMSNMLENQPGALLTTRSEDFTSMIESGEQLQKFYRGLFVDLKKNPQQVDLSLAAKLLDDYFFDLQSYLKALEDELLDLQFPLNSLNDPLPEEELGDFVGDVYPSPTPNPNVDSIILDAGSEKNIPAWIAPIENRSEKQVNAQVSFPFNAARSKEYYKFINFNLRPCGDMKQYFRRDGGEDSWSWIVAGGDIFTPEINAIKRNGLPLDVSILRLIPRPALWLAHLDSKRFEVGACISALEVYSFGFGPWEDLEFNKGDVRWGFQIQVRLTFTDHASSTSNQAAPIGTLNTRIRIRTPTKLPEDLNHQLKPIISYTWNGNEIVGFKVGPIAQHFENYFYIQNPTSNESENLYTIKYIGENVRLNHQSLQDFYRRSKIGTLATKREKASQSLKILKSLRFFQSVDVPEVDEFMALVDQTKNLTSPDDIFDTITRKGQSVESVRIKLVDQQLALKRKVIFGLSEKGLSGRVILKPVRTPVDERLETIRTLQKAVREREQKIGY